MYELTKQERATLVNGMVELFNEYDYDYTFTAIDKIIDTWCANKSTLIEAFKKHPNYVDGKFLIAFDVDYTREIDTSATIHFAEWLFLVADSKSMINNLPQEIKDKLRSYQWITEELYHVIFRKVLPVKTRTIDDEVASHINAVLPNIRARGGQKTSRVVNKILTYLNYHLHPDYNREFAKYADALTPLTIKRHTILSLNPLDYLTMSFGNSWSSCHTIDKHNKRGMPNGYEGQYSSGTMSYMLDGTSMVLYVVDSKYNGNDYFTQDKINRQMFHYGEEKLIQGRLYPQGNDGNGEQYTQYRQVVQSIIAECFDFPNRWIKKNTCMSNCVDSYGTHYRDYYNFDDCNITTPRGTENERSLVIGHAPICIECGDEHDESESINCCHCGYTCANCGCRIDDGDEIEIDGEYYCDDCVEYCEDCNEYHRNCDMEYVDGVGRSVCEDCLEQYYTRCEDCGEYIPNEDIMCENIDGRERYVCESCLEDYYYCEDCGEYYSYRNVVEDEDGTYYCRDCMAKREAEKEEEDE